MGVFSAMLDLLFPPRCVFCHGLLRKGEAEICASCVGSLPRTRGGAPKKGDFFSVCVAPLYYEKNVRESLLRYKFHGADAYAKTYGRLLADCIREELAEPYDLISWVPLSRKRLRERGYDQAKLLALAAAGTLGEQAICTLEKTRDVQKQSTLNSPEKRRANVSGVYRVPDPERIAGKRILLIDDIVTTGATLSECARTLLEAGAARVLCAAVACSRD